MRVIRLLCVIGLVLVSGILGGAPASAALPGYYIPGYTPLGSASPATAATPPAPRAYHVGIQIGHYKIKEVPPALAPISRDLGTYGGGRDEVDVAYDVANLLAPLLRAGGVEVDLLPTTVPTGYSADAFVSLHADGSNAKDRRGFKVATRYRSQVAAQDGALVESITARYAEATGLPQDYRVNSNMRDYYAFSPDRPNYRVSNYTPVALIEMGYMTHPSDRKIMFDAADSLASGLAVGIMQFLKTTYGNPSSARSFGTGIVDKAIDPRARTFPAGGTPDDAHREEGDWQLLLTGSPTIKVYATSDGGGGVIANLPDGTMLPSTLRIGSFYRIALPGSEDTPGWVYVNYTIVQMPPEK